MVRMMIAREPGALAANQQERDPFDGRWAVPVAGGALNVAYAGPPPPDAEVVVLAVHGVTASHMAWRTVARRLAGAGACLIAPDLRGRGRSATLPGPYGLGTHVSDLTAVLDHAGAQRAVMVGHSMGAHVAARLSAEQPERSAGLVLVDGGLPRLAPLQEADDEPEGDDPTPGRLEQRPCASPEDYVAGWRAHPAFARAWDEDVAAYAHYDMAHDEARGARCVVREEAVTADGFDLLFDGVTRKALSRVRAPIHLLRAPRGALDDDCPVIPQDYLDAFAADHPHLEVEHVADTNHYTLVLGSSPGPARVASAIERALQAAGRPVAS